MIDNYSEFTRHDLATAFLHLAKVYEDQVIMLEGAKRDGEAIALDVLEHARSISSLTWVITRGLMNNRLKIEEN